MQSSLYTGISGLNANMSNLSVIGNNISNVNTVGFKGSRVTFGDVRAIVRGDSVTLGPFRFVHDAGDGSLHVDIGAGDLRLTKRVAAVARRVYAIERDSAELRDPTAAKRAGLPIWSSFAPMR